MDRHEEAQKALRERLIGELDPRVHVATRAFFKHLKPETVAVLGEFQKRYSRLLIETAFALRDITEKVEKEAVGPLDTETDGRLPVAMDFINGRSTMLWGITPDVLLGFEEFSETLEALRGLEDDGLYITLRNTPMHVATQLLDDDFYGEQIRTAFESLEDSPALA